MENTTFFFKARITLLALCGLPIFLSATLGPSGEPYTEQGISWQRMVIDDEQAHCRVDFPGKPRCAVTDQAYIIRSEYQGCVYELDVSLEFKKTQTPRVQELAQGLSLQWKEPDFEVKILQQKMLGVSYVVELCSVKQQPGSMVGRFYCSEEGVMYTLWVYGSGVPHYEIFDTFSLKSTVNILD